MSRRKRSRESMSPSYDVAYENCDVRDLGTSLRGVRSPGQHVFHVFLPHGKVRHIEEMGPQDIVVNDEYAIHFKKAEHRVEFVEKLSLGVDEFYIDDKPAISNRLDHIHTESYRCNKELSDQLQKVADRLETLEKVLSEHLEHKQKQQKRGQISSNGNAAAAKSTGSTGRKKK